ncbi:MAG: amidohydrolase [Actinobacteria bacterium]|nr:amidohydrolase [Actinomycetota bacterium]
MQWATIEGKTRLLVGGRVNRFIPNPAFTHLARPGALSEYFRGEAGVGDMRAAFGELEPIEAHPEYRDRAARLRVMDAQGLESCIMLPTLGVGMEAALEHDLPALTTAFSAFNRWLDEDWGYDHEGRIYAAPYLTLADPAWAVDELERVLARDARVILMRPASMLGADGRRRSPGHSDHDAFWARMAEAGVTLVVHGGDSSYEAYERLWGITDDHEAFRMPLLRRMLSASPIRDTIASFIADRLFERHPNLRVATIETGSDWVAPLLKKLRTLSIQLPGEFTSDPVETFRQHVWVSPFFEDDVLALVDLVGADRVLFGSDFPHVEGLADPVSFVKELDGLPDTDVRKIMRDNARALVRPQSQA